MISGSELPPGQAAERYIRERGAKGATTIAGFALTASDRSMPRLPMA